MIQQSGEAGAAPSKPKNAQDHSEPAARALAEAAERRARSAARVASENEVEGRGGLEPTRYGDWEVKGLASDF